MRKYAEALSFSALFSIDMEHEWYSCCCSEGEERKLSANMLHACTVVVKVTFLPHDQTAEAELRPSVMQCGCWHVRLHPWETQMHPGFVFFAGLWAAQIHFHLSLPWVAYSWQDRSTGLSRGHHVKVLANKPDDLSSVLTVPVVGENRSQKLSSELQACPVACVCPRT